MRLFGVKTTTSTDELLDANTDYNIKYEAIDNINFTAIFAKKLATLSTSESDVYISGDTKRAKALNDITQSLWSKIKKIISRTLGTGGVCVVPYVQNNRLLYDIVSQDRVCINEKIGDNITSIIILSETVKINDIKYCRWTNYDLKDGSCYISTKITDDNGNPRTVEQWKDIQDMAIQNVVKIPVCYIKSPVDNRQTSDFYGVPITYGCDNVIDEIMQCLKQIVDEFELKQVRLQADERTFTKDKNGNPVLPSKLFMIVKNGANDNVFNVFDPMLRDTSYYNRLSNLFGLLEKQVGTSRGILTEPQSRGATATEIKAGMYDTYSLISDIRDSVEKLIIDFLYACDVLSNYYDLTPIGQYEVKFDWSYSMIESSTETWSQLKDGQSIGVRSKAELRAWQTGETLDEAQTVIDEIKQKEPTLSEIIGVQ